MRRPLVLRGAAVLCGLAIAALAVLVLAAPGREEPAQATARRTGPLVVALVDGSPSGPVRGALAHRLGLLGAVAPRWAEVRADGLLDARMPDARVRALAARDAAILPVVHGSGNAVAAVLADPQLRNRVAIRTARSLDALRAGGVLLDLDDVPVARRGDLVALAATLARLIGPERTLVVDVPAATDADAAVQAAYDLRALSRSALVLLSPPPVRPVAPGVRAPLAWWRAVVARGVREAPARRLLLLLPTGAERWEGGAVRPASQAEAYRAITEDARGGPDGVAIGDASDGWVAETDRSAELKLRVARDAGVAGVVLDLHGGESTRLWALPLVDPAAR